MRQNAYTQVAGDQMREEVGPAFTVNAKKLFQCNDSNEIICVFRDGFLTD